MNIFAQHNQTQMTFAEMDTRDERKCVPDDIKGANKLRKRERIQHSR